VTNHHLVVPHDPALFARLRGRSLVVCARDPLAVRAIVTDADQHGCQLHTVWLQTGGTLADVKLHPSWRRCRIALEVDGMGAYLSVRRLLEPLSKLRVRVYLSTRDPENLTAIRILASLGVACAVVIEEPVDWDLLSDLSAYALLGLRDHGAIEPMHLLSRKYQPDRRTDISELYFDDPGTFLHVDSAGQVALSRAELLRGEIILDDLEQLPNIEGLPSYDERLEAWREHFVTADGCSACPGWRICLGRYQHLAPDCSAFFEDLLETVEQRQARVAHEHSA
jgi:hypothetical protein